MTTLENVKLISLKTFTDSEGSLVPIESGLSIPFKIKRVFYVFDVHDQKDRGEHSHHKTEQILICLSGKVKVLCDDGKNTKQWVLDTPT